MNGLHPQADDAYGMGVLLFWNVHQDVGPYGYIAVFAPRTSTIPMLLRQADLIDPDRPAEGCLVNFELKLPGCLDCGISRAAVEGFGARIREFDFDSTEVSGFHLLKPDRPIDRYLLDGLSPVLKEWMQRMCAIDAAIEKIRTVPPETTEKKLKELGQMSNEGSVIQDWDKTPPGIIEYVNTVIADPSLYQPERFTDINLRRVTQLLLAKNPQNFERIWLNRLLLEDAYPETLIRKLKGTDSSPKPVRGRVDSYDLRNQQGSLKHRDGSTVFFGADAFPASDIIPRTGDLVQFRQCGDQAYDIWPLSSSKEALDLHPGKLQAPSESPGKLVVARLSRGPFQYDLVKNEIKCGKLLFAVPPLYAPVIGAMLRRAPGSMDIITKLTYFAIAMLFKAARLREEGVESETRLKKMLMARKDEIKKDRKRIAQAWRRGFGDWLRDKCKIAPDSFIMCLEKEECYQLGPGWNRERPIIAASQVGERLMGKNIENMGGPDDEEYKSHMKPKRMGIPGENDDRQGY